jgi:hypothetical protein
MDYKQRIAMYHNKANGAYNNANGGLVRGAQALNPVDRTLSVTLTPISTTISGAARIFGAFVSPDETYNTANNMTVAISESSHIQVKKASEANPFRVKGVLYTVSNALQLAQPIVITKASIAGSSEIATWQPQNYTAPTNYNALQIKTSALQAVIDGYTRFDINFLAGYNASMILTINDKVDQSSLLSNKVPIKSAE